MRIAVVLVTYNRLDCLKIALSRYEQQSKLPLYIIVVNNASTDGTYDYLQSWKCINNGINKIVVHNEENMGGAGGFYTGIKESLKYDYDYVFLADDDAYAENDTFEKLFSNTMLVKASSTAALCTSVINHGKRDISHRCRVYRGVFRVGLKWIPEEEYKNDYFELDVVTFVGAAIKKETVNKVGLPEKDYFIYYDDTEYFFRIMDVGRVYCITSSQMIHDTNAKQSINSWKGYYDTRNWIDAVHRHFSKMNYLFVIVSSYIKRCTIIATIMRSRDNAFKKMCKVAISDARHGNMGKSKVYYPGAKFK